jgi:SAM-dependent methyltransferase
MAGRINMLARRISVFAPIRREYVDLVSTTLLPAACASSSVAFDIGTGVLAAVLARRDIERVVATDLDPHALACARENVRQLGLSERVDVVEADLFPEGRMPRGFLLALPEHLEPGVEGWLILSDLAEHFGLRTRAQWLQEIEAAGLRVMGRNDVQPRHPRAADRTDPLHVAHAAEITSLWRLAVR